MGVHCIMYIGNMWKLLFGPENVYIFELVVQLSVASCAKASAAGGSAEMTIEQLFQIIDDG